MDPLLPNVSLANSVSPQNQTRICEACAKVGIVSEVRKYWINLEEKIEMCLTKGCVYPLMLDQLGQCSAKSQLTGCASNHNQPIQQEHSHTPQGDGVGAVVGSDFWYELDSLMGPADGEDGFGQHHHPTTYQVPLQSNTVTVDQHQQQEASEWQRLATNDTDDNANNFADFLDSWMSRDSQVVGHCQNDANETMVTPTLATTNMVENNVQQHESVLTQLSNCSQLGDGEYPATDVIPKMDVPDTSLSPGTYLANGQPIKKWKADGCGATTLEAVDTLAARQVALPSIESRVKNEDSLKPSRGSYSKVDNWSSGKESVSARFKQFMLQAGERPDRVDREISHKPNPGAVLAGYVPLSSSGAKTMKKRMPHLKPNAKLDRLNHSSQSRLLPVWATSIFDLVAKPVIVPTPRQERLTKVTKPSKAKCHQDDHPASTDNASMPPLVGRPSKIFLGYQPKCQPSRSRCKGKTKGTEVMPEVQPGVVNKVTPTDTFTAKVTKPRARRCRKQQAAFVMEIEKFANVEKDGDDNVIHGKTNVLGQQELTPLTTSECLQESLSTPAAFVGSSVVGTANGGIMRCVSKCLVSPLQETPTTESHPEPVVPAQLVNNEKTLVRGRRQRTPRVKSIEKQTKPMTVLPVLASKECAPGLAEVVEARPAVPSLCEGTASGAALIDVDMTPATGGDQLWMPVTQCTSIAFKPKSRGRDYSLNKRSTDKVALALSSPIAASEPKSRGRDYSLHKRSTEKVALALASPIAASKPLTSEMTPVVRAAGTFENAKMSKWVTCIQDLISTRSAAEPNKRCTRERRKPKKVAAQPVIEPPTDQLVKGKNCCVYVERWLSTKSPEKFFPGYPAKSQRQATVEGSVSEDSGMHSSSSTHSDAMHPSRTVTPTFL